MNRADRRRAGRRGSGESMERFHLRQEFAAEAVECRRLIAQLDTALPGYDLRLATLEANVVMAETFAAGSDRAAMVASDEFLSEAVKRELEWAAA